MEENKSIKISFNKIIFLIIIGIIMVLAVAVFLFYIGENKINNIDYQKIEGTVDKSYLKENKKDIIKEEEKYEKSLTVEKFYEYKILNNYNDYEKIIENLNHTSKEYVYNSSESRLQFNNEIFKEKNLLVIFIYSYIYFSDDEILDTNIVSFNEKSNVVNLKITDDSIGFVASDGGRAKLNVYIIPVSKNITVADIEYPYHNPISICKIIEVGIPIIFLILIIVMIIGIIKNKNKNKRKKYIIGLILLILILLCIEIINIINYNSDEISPSEKPIIYLYPKEDELVSVNLGYKDKITCSYPKYINGWNVLAKTNGDLIDVETNKFLYSLYYESNNIIKFDVKEDGFVVKSDNISEFLEEKLAILGLTDREKEEFIIYWLPTLQKNEYNYIRFATTEEINKNMPLQINPNPDTIIRILMTFKGLKSPIKVKEQELITPERKGFVAVEWGGTEIK